MYALANSGGSHAPAAGTYPSSYPYQDKTALFDVTSGSDGTCAASQAYLCTAGPGCDGPTGLGAPDGLAGFSAPAAGHGGTGQDPPAGQQPPG